MDWTQLDWAALDRLRDGFINRTAGGVSYWHSKTDLASYDFTYAERIGWKWDAVLTELRRRNWTPATTIRTVLDWGCGSGIASRRILRAFGAENFETLLLWDQSPLARDFSAEAARHEFPGIKTISMESPVPPSEPFMIVLSHVISELPAPVLSALLTLVQRADAVIWVEPGTHADSRALVAVREQLQAEFHVAAPCTHAAACGLLAPGNERDWCHNFAAPPSSIYADSNWVKFGQRAGVDLRSLPYCFLTLDRKQPGNIRPTTIPETASRIIGRPKFHKAHAAICSCDASGVRDLTLYKRGDPAFFKKLDKHLAHPPLYVWQYDEAGRITSASPAQPERE